MTEIDINNIQDEAIKSYVVTLQNENECFRKKLEQKTKFALRVSMLVVISIIFFTTGFLFWNIVGFDDIYTGKRYINKNELKQTIQTIIENNGDLDIVKHVFDSKHLVSKPFYKSESDYEKDYYREDVSLSFVLNDLLADSHKNKSHKNDNGYINRLRRLTTENNLINPFGQLDEMQKYYFDNIRCKLDSNYIVVQPDINKVTEELCTKNQLVNKYLNKSEASFLISIIALVATLLISFFQIYQTNKSSKKLRNIILGKYR
jgi:hypothetical protein|nr:MAG TPA: hypothetical protein [Caudoviricetes sp.]